MKIQIQNEISFFRFNILVLLFIFTIPSKISFGQKIDRDTGTATVFIGYTERVQSNDSDNSTTEFVKIYSVKDYERIFGKSPNKDYLLYPSIRMFYENGGREAYIVSVGKINNDQPGFRKSDFIDGINKLKQFEKPTLIVVPESVRLKPFEAGSVHSEMMRKAAELGNCFAILDIVDGDQSIDSKFKPIFNFKRYSGSSNLEYGAAYYPWVVSSYSSGVGLQQDGSTNRISLPPGAAVAGAIVQSDSNKGIWKSAANIALNGVVEPSVLLTETEISDLNIDAKTGKSINPIVDFQNKGTLIWGARTLKGNDNLMRYISSKRLISQIEFDLKREISSFKNSPNNESTWKEIINIVENYLDQKWRAGAFAGSKPGNAYFVKCGLNSTMTAQDIANGKLIVTLGGAVIKPAEFFQLHIVQQMSK